MASEMKIIQHQIVEKGWGYEKIFVNLPIYCGKILHIEKNEKTSMHFHKDKIETWHALSGQFIIHTINTKNASRTQIVFMPNMTIHLQNFVIHQVEAIETGDILEVSTYDDPTDSYRVEAGSTQTRK